MSGTEVEPITVTPDATAPAVISAPETPAPVESKPPRQLPAFIKNPLMLLLLLTLVGGGMRFSFLDKPCIWFDESATYARASARYVELLEALEEAGFGPLHYH